jgi:hypothetical protein
MKADHTPKFIRAKTAAALQRAMLQNNLKRRGWHRYEIIFDGKDWYAWFYINTSDVGAIEELNDQPE